MEQQPASAVDGGELPAHGNGRDLRQVSDAEWLRECHRWLLGIKPTFSLVHEGLESEKLSRAAIELADLSNALMMAADRHQVASDDLWVFGGHLRSFAEFGGAEHLEKARRLILRASGLVMSLRNRLIVALDPARPLEEKALTTQKPSKPIPNIERIIHETLDSLDPSRGLTAKELGRALLDGDERVGESGVRKAIGRLRDRGIPIGNQPGVGYFLER